MRRSPLAVFLAVLALTVGAGISHWLPQQQAEAVGVISIQGAPNPSGEQGQVQTGTWAEDCAGANLHCVPFDDDTDITNWLVNGNNGRSHDPTRAEANSELVDYIPESGCMGTGAVSIQDPPGVGEQQAYLSIQTWPSATSDANIQVEADIEDVVPIGTTAWARFCVNFSSALLNEVFSFGGHKITSWTGAYNSNTEQETFFMRNGGTVGGVPRQYTSVSNTNAGNDWYFTAIGGGDFDMQPGSEFGFCGDETEPVGCYVYDPDTWYVVRMGATLAADTEDTTHVTVDVAKYGDADWTRIYDRNDLGVDEDYSNDGPGGEEGYSAFVIWNRHEADANAKPTGIIQSFSNVIMQEGGDGPPLPDWDEWVHAPDWFLDEPVNRWQIIPGTDTTTIYDVTTDPLSGTNLGAFSGMAAYGHKLWWAGGGHSIGGAQNTVYVLDISGDTATWTPAIDGSDGDCSGGLADCGFHTTGTLDDGARVPDHNYSHMVATGNDTLYFGAIGGAIDCPSGCSNGTFASTAVWKWRQADIANGEKGYDYIANAWSGAGGQPAEAAACYVPTENYVMVFSQNAFQTIGSNKPIWKINLANDSIAQIDPYSNSGSGPNDDWISACAGVVDLGVLVAVTADNTIKTTPIANPGTWTNRVITGTYNQDYHKHSAYSPAARQFFTREIGAGNTIRYLSVPSVSSGPGGTWTAGNSSAASGGVNVGDPVEATDGSVYSRMLNIIPNFMNSACDLLLYWPILDGPVYFQRICDPRSAMFEVVSPVNDDYYERRLAA